MSTTSKIMGVVQGQSKSALADALGNIIKDTYITNVTWDSSTHTLAFWGGSVLKYSCVIELAPQPLVDDPTKPLYLLSKQNGSTVTLSGNGATAYTDIYQTSTDNVTWTDYTLGTPITLNSGEGVYFRIKADKAQFFTQTEFVTFSTSTGVIEAYHNVNSMLSPNFNNLTDLTTVVGSGAYCLGSLFGPYSGTAPYLTKAPLLPATVLSYGCYYNMFFGCTSLAQAPELQVTTLARQCYFYMFSGCTSLAQAPELPATTLGERCYSNMFEDCTSLIEAPELPATTLANNCYSSMFKGCTSLTQAPELPATTLTNSCYSGMFRGCSSLSEVRIAATDISASSCLSNWLSGVSSAGNFYCEPGILYPVGASGIPTNWVRHDIPAIEDDPTKPLYLLSKQGGSVVKLTKQGSYSYPTYQTSTDNETWTDYTFGTSITLNKGEGVYFRIKQARTSAYSESQYVTFRTSTGVIEAYHNIKSMLSPDFTNMSSIAVNYAFPYLFGGTSTTYNYLKKAPLFPGNDLTNSSHCCHGMFYNCTGLTVPPAVPARNLGTYCYYEMFRGCTSLVRTPVALPATTLKTYCYNNMFYGCTSLTKNMSSLPAHTLVNSCYGGMFYGCSSLKEIRIRATDISASNCLSSWLSGVSSTGDFYCVTGVSYSSGTGGIPTNWTRRDINDYPST